MSIKITNDYGKDLSFKLQPAEGSDLPEEITIKEGEEYEVPAEKSAEILNWFLGAVLKSNGESTESTEPTVGEEGATKTVENARKFDVEVKYVENDEEKTVTVKAGESIEVPEDLAEDIEKQISDAEEPKKEEEPTETPVVSEKEAALSEKEAALAEREAALAEKEAKAEFTALVKEGRLVPAQEASFMALATKSKEAVVVSEGKSKSVKALLAELLQNAPAHSLHEETGEDGTPDDTPSEPEISEEEKALGEVFGNSEADLKKVKQEEGE